MDWNASNGGPLSPKKKLHLKAKSSLEDAVKNVRNELKNAKDISARNLLAHCGGTDTSSSDDSSLEEVMMIEEETTEFVSEGEEEEVIEEEEYYEEILDDSDATDDSELEPLPPPIEIPDALKVKDSDDEAGSAMDTDDDSDTTDEQKDQRTGKRATDAKNKEQRHKLSHDPDNMRSKKVRGPSCNSVVPAKPQQEKKSEPKKGAVIGAPLASTVNPLRPTKFRGHSFEVGAKFVAPEKQLNNAMETHEESYDDEPGSAPSTPKTPTRPRAPAPLTAPNSPLSSFSSTVPAPNFSSPVVNNEDGRPDVSWKKPDWTMNTKLRSTGKSAAENLAKPITNLPHMNKNYDDDDCKPPARTPSTEPVKAPPTVVTPIIQMPTRPIKPYASLHQTPTKTPKAKVKKETAPKSAPQTRKCPAPPVAAAADDDTLPAIGWEKPEWAKKKVLRDTSKTAKLMSGQKLERPIGGIKPVDTD